MPPWAYPAELRRSGGVPSESPSTLDAKQPRTDRSAESPYTDDHQPPTATSHQRISDSGHQLVAAVVLEYSAALLFALGVGGCPDRLVALQA